MDWLPDEKLLKVVNSDLLKRELYGLSTVLGKPFILKAMILNYNIGFLNKIFPDAIFIQVKRDPVSNVASILEARKRQFGTVNEWYSFKSPEYQELPHLDPVMQATGQYYYINRAVSEGMQKVDDSRKMVIQYETFCNCPVDIYRRLIKKVGIESKCYRGPVKFNAKYRMNSVHESQIKKALQEFEAQ